MNKILPISLATMLAFAMAAVPVFAHHGISDYDLTKKVTFQATVVEFQFINPHSLIKFTVKNDQGKTEEWQGELQSPSMLSRHGHWTRDTVKPGDQITIEGSPVKNGSNNMQVRKIVLADGQEFPGG